MIKNSVNRYSAAVMLVLALAFSASAFADDPPVKKSKSGICHAAGSTYYSRTKNYTAYSSMAACLQSGGRLPKR